MPDNAVTVVGNLTRDPELRYTQTGTARAVLGVAVNRRWTNRRTNEVEESVSFFNVVCWDTLAQNVAESLAKGNRVVVAGRLEQRTWDTQEGEKRNVVEIVAQEVAPSLRWATADVARNPQGGGYQQGGGGGYQQGGYGNQPAEGGGGGFDSPAAGGHEEPF